jgi:DNA polymerase (family 10)
MRNQEVADILYEIADLLEIKGVEWKPRAYRRAARNIETLSEGISEIRKRDELDEIPGVGESIESKIREYLDTGQLEYLKELRKDQPVKLRTLMNIEGIGPNTADKLYERLNITTVGELEEAAKSGKIRELEGFGKRTEGRILEGIERYRTSSDRFILGFMLPDIKDILEKLENHEHVNRIEVAGSVRRQRATIGDADILVTSEEPAGVMEFFTGLPEVKSILSKGKRKSTCILSNNLQVDLLVIKEENFGAALLYFTGSKAHNVALRKRAIDENWKLNEYGLQERDKGKKLASKTEEAIYEKLGLKYIRPQLREDRGEIEAAEEGSLPDVITLDDLRCDLHVHSNWSEAEHSISQMAEAAKAQGYEYMALTDHSQALPIAQGLDEEEFEERQKEIDEVNDSMEAFVVLSGAEVNIDSEGGLDLIEDALEKLDVVVAAIHSGYRQGEEKITDRLLSAIHNEHVDIIGHPTGRLIQDRDPLPVDFPSVCEAAEDQGTLLEINSFPTRLDLSDENLFQAREYDIQFSLGTDSHSVEHLRYMEIGVGNAQRGWIEKSRIVNRLSAKDLLKLLD